jgi:hypothetical protein
VAQLGRAGDVAVPRVVGHSDLKPLVTHWVWLWSPSPSP